MTNPTNYVKPSLTASQYGHKTPTKNYLLLEIDDYLLLENGDKMILEATELKASNYIKTSPNPANYT